MEKVDCKSKTYTYTCMEASCSHLLLSRFSWDSYVSNKWYKDWERDNFVTFLTYNFAETSQVYLLR